MTTPSVLVVDDEPLARRRAIRLLRQVADGATVEEAGDIVEARRILNQKPIDVMLLDVRMPGGDGFELLEGLETPPGAVIFITAFDDLALRAFEARAVDYITKPIEPGRFKVAMERALSVAQARLHEDRIAELTEALNALRQGGSERLLSELWVRSRGDHVRVPLTAVSRFEAERDYVRVHAGEKTYLHHESLTSLAGRLDPGTFMRIHRSTIVRRDAVIRVRREPLSTLTAVLTDGAEVRVGRTYAQAVRTGLVRAS